MEHRIRKSLVIACYPVIDGCSRILLNVGQSRSADMCTIVGPVTKATINTIPVRIDTAPSVNTTQLNNGWTNKKSPCYLGLIA